LIIRNDARQQPLDRYGKKEKDTLKKKTTHWFSELAVKLEIINISPEFVAFF
jgi:hypothetical protein